MVGDEEVRGPEGGLGAGERDAVDVFEGGAAAAVEDEDGFGRWRGGHSLFFGVCCCWDLMICMILLCSIAVAIIGSFKVVIFQGKGKGQLMDKLKLRSRSCDIDESVEFCSGALWEKSA